MSYESTGHDNPVQHLPPPISAFSMRGSLSPLLLIPIAAPVIAALFAPDNVLDLWPWIKRFTAWIQRIVPFMHMGGHADSTTYPQAAVLTHSLTLMVIPFTSLVWLWQSIVNYPYLLARRKAMGPAPIKLHLMILLVGLPFFLGVVYLFMVLPGDPSFANGMTTKSRGGFAFLTFAVNYCTSMVLGGQLLNVRLFSDTHLRKGD
jgi:hypothetical protein